MSEREVVASVRRDTYRFLEVSIGPDFAGQFDGEPLCWMVYYTTGGNYVQPVQVPIRDKAKARALAEHLFAELAEEWQASEDRRDARDAKRAAKDESERPARERAAREAAAELAERLAATEPEEASKCPECDHVDDHEAFSEPGYECGRCGQGSRGEDGRRCSTCNIFTAKTSAESCPSCEQPVEPEPVQAKNVGGDWHEVETEDAEVVDL